MHTINENLLIECLEKLNVEIDVSERNDIKKTIENLNELVFGEGRDRALVCEKLLIHHLFEDYDNIKQKYSIIFKNVRRVKFLKNRKNSFGDIGVEAGMVAVEFIPENYDIHKERT